MVQLSKAKADKAGNLYKQPQSKRGTSRILLLIVLILIGLLVYQHNYSEDEINALLEEKKELSTEFEKKLTSLTKEMMDAEEEKHGAEQSRHELEVELRELKKDNDEIKAKPKKSKGGEKETSSKVKDVMLAQLTKLETDVQRMAKNTVLEKYGPEPYRVEFQIEFNPEEVPEGTADKFVIEMAPLDYMPYTVHFFLEQASKGLLDGCSFHRNAGHVVQGGPISNHLSQGRNVRKPFQEADLTSVAFQEYHEKFPHVKYTLGYAGRPGGPDFYVSTIDNTKNHGPGGQGSYAIKSEADPCFAKVIEGFEAVNRMATVSVQPGSYKRMEHYIAIKSAKIVKS
mmetsp:Transcript_6188/g.9133  ORF Transcript_6188/g.9133 Transcript_6188/m.9133 type:complete len:341 (-) Transcript_6188:139-1161(-)